MSDDNSVSFSYDDDVVLEVMWELYQKTLMEIIQLKAQLKTAEETVRRLMPDDTSVVTTSVD